MIASKHITKFVAVIMVIVVCLCLTGMAFSDEIMKASGSTGIAMEYESKLFDTSQIISVDIIMDEADWKDMLANSTEESYYECNVKINGDMFYRVGIRPKGNTSLSSIASDPTTDRYSFKLEFDQYIDEQTCYGLDKLILNNNYADATNMKEALIYDMYQYLGVDASLYNYAKISVNGEYWGVYLALEAVEDSFLLRNYGTENGELYKPDHMDFGNKAGNRGTEIGGGMFLPKENTSENTDQTGETTQGFGGQMPPGGMPNSGERPNSGRMPNSGEMSNSDETPNNGGMPNIGERPEMGGFDFSEKASIKGGFSMGNGGSDLNYSDDELDSYSTIWEGEVTKTSDSDHKRVVSALKNISEGTNLEDYMDIDNLLKYMAVHIFSVNADSLSGSMAHNYYLYESGGKLNILPWDYNLALGGMGGKSDSSSATSIVNDAIDNAFASTNFFDSLLLNEEYHAQYYAYLQQLVDEYLLGDGFEDFYTHTRNQIDSLVESDPTAFYSYEEYLEATETLYEIVHLRGESISRQINGAIPSIKSEQQNSGVLIDASHLDISVMGSMNMGGGGGQSFDGFNRGEMPEGFDASQIIGEMPEGFDPSQIMGEIPEGFDPSQFGGEMPEGFDPSQIMGEMPEGFDPSQFGGEMPEGFDPSQIGGNTQESDQSVEASSDTLDKNVQGNTQWQDRFENIPSMNTNINRSSIQENLIMYGICFAIIIFALIFAKLYRRKPNRR